MSLQSIYNRARSIQKGNKIHKSTTPGVQFTNCPMIPRFQSGKQGMEQWARERRECRA